MLERRRGGDAIVQDMSLGVVARRVLRPPTQFLAQKHVLDPGPGQHRLDLVGVELRRVLGIRLRPYVRHDLDLVLPQQGDERRLVVIRMPDREDGPLVGGGLARSWSQVGLHLSNCGTWVRGQCAVRREAVMIARMGTGNPRGRV